MNGRVLSKDEIQIVESRASLPYFHTTLIGKKDVLNLIVTVRDRDKTIAELQNDVSSLCKVSILNDQHENELIQQNTILREALEFYANKKTYELGVKISMGTSHPQHEPIKYDKGDIAREALDKVKE